MTDMTDNKSVLDAIRLEIASLPPEYQVLARYIDAHYSAQAEQIEDMRRAFETAKGAASAVKWLSGIGAAGAVIWGAIHGVKP